MEHEHKRMHSGLKQLCRQALNKDFSYQCHEQVFQDHLLSSTLMKIFTVSFCNIY